ncbi:hypothetical protein DPMN_074727 [Dreissena polymorpha]|uniref:Uncharacterized protein n=1 Tax=Dreissena polymorpha TaxID=45954 RepID=A0A9D4BEA6_DREPO|nr:hypothetical protein DPMN_074727 [Dreissena polymorpha]
MASLADMFKEKERTNWLKVWLAIDISKSGLNTSLTTKLGIFTSTFKAKKDQLAQAVPQHIYNITNNAQGRFVIKFVRKLSRNIGIKSVLGRIHLRIPGKQTIGKL